MKIRAGIVLIEDNKVALIERYRAGLHYYSFPGGGVDDGESPKQAAIRETMEELGIEVTIKQKVADVRLGNKSRQFYFLVDRIGGEFGTGTGKEFETSNLDNPKKGIYIPIWMPIEEVSQHTNIFPAEVANLTVYAAQEGWPLEPVVVFEKSK